jgi:O-antigen/teichoic acid export membrane protein
MKEMLKYAVPLGVAGILATLMLQTNQMVVSAMCSPEEFANYVNGAIEIPLIGVITGSIASVILVDMTDYVHKGENSKALELFKLSSVKSAGILFPVMFFLLGAGKPFIVTLYSEKYLESVVPFYIYLFVLPIRIVVYGSALMALGKSKVILNRSIVDLAINTLLSILFVHLFGYLGAAIATITTLYLWHVPYNLFQIGKGFSVGILETLPFKKLGLITVLCIVPMPIFFLNLLIPERAYFLKLIVDAFLYLPAVGLLLLKYRLLEIPQNIFRFVPKVLLSWLKIN